MWKRRPCFSIRRTPYGAGLAERFKQDFIANGGTIVAEAEYKRGRQGFHHASSNALKEKAPEVIFLPSYYAEAGVDHPAGPQRLAWRCPFSAPTAGTPRSSWRWAARR